MSNPVSKEPKVANVPNLRFAYSEDIAPRNLSFFLEVRSERNTKGLFDKNDVLSVSGDSGIVNQIELLGRSYAGESVLLYHVVEVNDIVYTKSPLASNPYGIIKTNGYKAGIVSTLYAVYKAKTNCNPFFVQHYFDYKPRINKYLRPIVRIGAKHDMKIGNQEVLENTVFFPSVQEQNEIVSFLELVNERIETQNKIIKEKEALRDFNLRRIFSLQGEHKALSSFFSFGKAGGTPNSTNKSYYGGDIPFLSISDVTEQGKYINRTEKTLSELGLRSSSSWLVPAHSLILSMYASVGLPAINEMPLATSQAMFAMVPNNADDLEFLYYYLLYFKKMKLCKYLETGTQSNVNADFVKNIMVPVVDDAKREHIVSVLKGLDDSIELEKKILQKMELQKRYLLRNLFI